MMLLQLTLVCQWRHEWHWQLTDQKGCGSKTGVRQIDPVDHNTAVTRRWQSYQAHLMQVQKSGERVQRYME